MGELLRRTWTLVLAWRRTVPYPPKTLSQQLKMVDTFGWGRMNYTESKGVLRRKT